MEEARLIIRKTWERASKMMDMVGGQGRDREEDVERDAAVWRGLPY